MRSRKWGFFPFDATNYKAAQAYLDKKAARGWVLDKITLGWFARFVPAAGRAHAVDLDALSAFEGGPDEDYLTLCADAGWELVKSHRRMLVFRSKAGVVPAPLNTDEGLEAERFWKKCVRRNLLAMLAAFLFLWGVLLLAVGTGGSSSLSQDLFCSYSGFVGCLTMALAILYGIWEIVGYLISYVKFRIHRTMAVHKSARIMGVLGFAIVLLLILFYILRFTEPFGLGKTVDAAWSTYSKEYTATVELCQSYPVITAGDLGLEPSEDSRYLDGKRTPWVDLLEYSEITPVAQATHILTTERYECANETLAKWLFDLRRGETATGSGFLWGELAWGPVGSEYGFDEICFARENSYLLAREGDTVVLVGASGLDLTGHMDTVRARLASE